MANSLQVPIPQRRPIDVFGLSQSLALPEVARQQRKAQVFQMLSALPQTILSSLSGIQQLKQQQEQLQRQRGEEALNLRPVKEVSPALASRFPEIADIPFGRIKDILPSVARGGPMGAVPEVPAITAEKALELGKIPKGTRIVSPARGPSELDIASKESLIKQREALLEKMKKPRLLTSRESEAAADLQSTIKNLEDIGKTSSKFEKFIGPLSFQAREGYLAKQYTKLAGDPEFRAFKAKVGRAYDRYRKLITGAQAAFPEIELLETRFPQTSDPIEQFNQIAGGLLDELKSKESILKNVLESQGKKYPIIDFELQVKEELDALIKKVPPDLANKARFAIKRGHDKETILDSLREDMRSYGKTR